MRTIPPKRNILLGAGSLYTSVYPTRVTGTSVQTLLLILVYWAMQVVAALAFKWGSSSPNPDTGRRRWLMGFVGGNAVGITSIVFLMLLFDRLNVNVAYGIGVGGAFLLAQVAMAVIYRSKLSALQYAGLMAMTVGMLLLGLGGAA